MQNNNWKDKWKKEASMSYKTNPSRPHRLDWKDKLKKYLMDPQYKAAQEKEEEAAKKLQEYEALQAKPETTPEDLKAFANANGFFSGALWSRNHATLAKASGERIPVTPSDVIRLHLELIDDWSKEDYDVVCKYGGLKGRRISRDVVVPADMLHQGTPVAVEQVPGPPGHLVSVVPDLDIPVIGNRALLHDIDRSAVVIPVTICCRCAPQQAENCHSIVDFFSVKRYYKQLDYLSPLEK